MTATELPNRFENLLDFLKAAPKARRLFSEEVVQVGHYVFMLVYDTGLRSHRMTYTRVEEGNYYLGMKDADLPGSIDVWTPNLEAHAEG